MEPYYPFQEQDSHTQFDNYVLDVMMPSLPPTAWKILTLIIRKTRGWIDRSTGERKRLDKISYKQIMEGTGIKSSATVCKGVKVLLARRYIVADGSGEWEATAYGLNLGYSVQPTSKNEPALFSKVDTASKSEVGSTSKNEDTKERVKKERKTDTTLRANDARAEPPQAMLPDSLSLDELGEIFTDEFERITDSLEGEQQKQVVYAQESLLNDSPPGKDVSVIRTSSCSAPVAPRATAKSKQPNPNTKPILDAYFSLLTYKPTNAKKEAAAAKALADDGYTPEQVAAAYRRMKSETFWQLKHLSLAKVHENIGALLPALSPPGNGQRASSRDGYTFLNV